MTSKISDIFEVIKFKSHDIFINHFKNPWGEDPKNQGREYGQNPTGKNDIPKKNSGVFGSKKPGIHPQNYDNKKLHQTLKDQIDQLIKEIKTMFGGNFNQSPNKKTPKSVIGLFILVLFVLWLGSGVYKVDSNENGLVLYFGKFYSISTPGLNYHLPAPFGKVIKKTVTTVNTDEFNSGKNNSNQQSESNSSNLMLTGDENIVDVDFQIQWQISDIKDFVLNLEEPELAIRKSAESAMREIIARTPIANALSDGKSRIEQETKDLLQQVLDSYGAGVRVVLVQMLRVDPPSQVIDSFRDVQTAKADKEREINQSQSYSNDIIPRARGEASKITEDAKAYKEEVVANAQGQASRFNAIYLEYSKSKVVTKKRMYLEQMEKVYRDIDKVIIDKNISKTGAIPYLPINSNKSKKGE